MSKANVSIIMPCYNSNNYIKDSICGIINQTYKEWELLIIDDCSTDNSYKTITDIANLDSRIKYFKTSINSGKPAIPRNIGIENAVGNYIAFCDSDDIWLPNKLEDQIKTFDSSISIVYSNYEKIDIHNNRKGRNIIAPSEITYKKLLYGNVIGNLTGIYDVRKVGKVFQQDIPHEDYIMWLEILKKGYKGMNTNTITALYREGSSTFSSSKLKTISWQWEIYRSVLKLNIFNSSFHFVFYAVNALRKYII